MVPISRSAFSFTRASMLISQPAHHRRHAPPMAHASLFGPLASVLSLVLQDGHVFGHKFNAVIFRLRVEFEWAQSLSRNEHSFLSLFLVLAQVG